MPWTGYPVTLGIRRPTRIGGDDTRGDARDLAGTVCGMQPDRGGVKDVELYELVGPRQRGEVILRAKSSWATHPALR